MTLPGVRRALQRLLMDNLKLAPDRDLTVIKRGFTTGPFLAGQNVDRGSTTAEHQARTMSEVAKLVLPAGMDKDQLGIMDANRFATTADIALKFKVISKPAEAEKAYTSELVHAAMKM